MFPVCRCRHRTPGNLGEWRPRGDACAGVLPIPGFRLIPGRCPGMESFAPSGLHGVGGAPEPGASPRARMLRPFGANFGWGASRGNSGHCPSRGFAPEPGALPRADLLRPFGANFGWGASRGNSGHYPCRRSVSPGALPREGILRPFGAAWGGRAAPRNPRRCPWTRGVAPG